PNGPPFPEWTFCRESSIALRMNLRSNPHLRHKDVGTLPLIVNGRPNACSRVRIVPFRSEGAGVCFHRGSFRAHHRATAINSDSFREILRPTSGLRMTVLENPTIVFRNLFSLVWPFRLCETDANDVRRQPR